MSVFALHSPSKVAGRAGYLVSARQQWEHFEYVTEWQRARHFNSVEEAERVAVSSRHAVAVISGADWRALGGT